MTHKPVNDAVGMEAAARMLEALGYDITTEDMRETPMRMWKALVEMSSGERESPQRHLAKQFERGGYDETVALSGIRFTALCEHHVLPFSGTAGVAYLTGAAPSAKIVGLSKLARLVDGFARRLQTQERMTADIADALERNLETRGVAVVVQASHSCMGCRGVQKPDAVMHTVVLRGAYRVDAAARAEVLNLLKR